MKKTLSLVLSLIMLVCSVSSVMNALAYTKADAPTVSLGENFEVDMKGVSALTILNMSEDSIAKSDFYCAKFIPEKTDYYQFVFDTDFSDTGEDSMLFTFIADAKDQVVNFDISFALSEEEKKEFEESEIEGAARPEMCSQLTKGKEYYLVVVNVSDSVYHSNVVIQNHTHKIYTDKMESYVDDENLSDSWDGEYYKSCDVNGCDFMETTKTIYAVKTISLSKSSYTYDGKEKKPSVTIKDRKGNKLDKKNYSVKYSSNKKVGTAKVKITFKNDYDVEYTKTFKINPKGTSLK
ncbi:MAG: hypothetical protein IJ731_09115, partial [Eubacterium sp.]|nr:hypothetical protein [Eubacterium sp.]